MKIATLTFPGSSSHGASLQMYALYTALSNIGADVEVINYISDMVNYKDVFSKNLKDRIASIFLKDTENSFKEFESHINIYPKTAIETTEQLRLHAKAYDRIIVGSDQVWNPVVTGNDMNFYLEFCSENHKKAAYAPSFGVDHITIEDENRIAELLRDFKYLSAREERGAELIYELTGRRVPVVLDPTFLIEGSDWRKLKRPSGATGDYVFVYTIKNSLKLRETAQRFADKYGYKLVYLAGGLHGVLDKFNPKKHPVFGVGPSEFLDLIDNAKCVFTNSFHGTALSIILNKSFYVEFSSDTNSRLITLINNFELKNRIIDCDNFDFNLGEINYEKVNCILEAKKKESLEYLEGIVV